LKELVVISREPSSSTFAHAFVASWSALFFLDGKSDKRAINVIFSESEFFQNQNQLVSVSISFFKNSFVLFEFLLLTISAKERLERES